MSTEQNSNKVAGGGSGLNVELDVDDLALLVRRLAHALNKASPNNDLTKKALDYLHRCELNASVMRNAAIRKRYRPNKWRIKI